MFAQNAPSHSADLILILDEQNGFGSAEGHGNGPGGRRLWRDAKLYEIGAGTSEIRRWLIGRELFSETA